MTSSRTFLDIHVLQTVPPSNINRDDTGSPKSAAYGGVRRARVSSQAWKRATRSEFRRFLDKEDLGTRTKRVVELLTEEIGKAFPDLTDRATEIAEAVFTKGGIKLTAPRKGGEEAKESGYLLFLSALQIKRLAALGAEAAQGDGLDALDKKTIGAIFKADNSIDLALFGRMVADVSDLNVDAAAQVAHAISVHAVDNEFDYFTAVDDHKAADTEEDAGAGMIGTVEFNSSTLYRYATVNVEGLRKNLGSAEATERAVKAFIDAFIRSMPTGKQNTFANGTLPDAVVVIAREDQPVSLVGAFEDAVTTPVGSGRVTAAAERLVAYAKDVEAVYGSAATSTWTVGVGDRTAVLDDLAPRTPLASLVDGVGTYVASRLAEEA